MTFYDSIYCGILRISYNEQHLWSWFRKKNIEPPRNHVKQLAEKVEGLLNGWDWNKSMSLDEVISAVYYKYKHAKKES
jgi:hypothetical protein